MTKKKLSDLECKLKTIVEELKEHKDEKVKERIQKISELLKSERCHKNIAGLRHEVVGIFHVLSYLRTLGEKIPQDLMSSLQHCEHHCDEIYKKIRP